MGFRLGLHLNNFSLSSSFPHSFLFSSSPTISANLPEDEKIKVSFQGSSLLWRSKGVRLIFPLDLQKVGTFTRNERYREILVGKERKRKRQSMAARYWCHMCSQMVNPIIDAEIKCPSCQSGFVEEMSGDINGGGRSSLREVQDQEIDFGTDRALSLWSPILLGMMNNPRRRRRFRRTDFGVDNDEVGAADVDENDSNVDSHHHRRRHRHRQHNGEIDLDREFESILRRRRRSSAAILQLLQGIRTGINSEYESSQGSTGLNQNRNNTSLSAMGDYFVGPGLDHLLEHLADNDPIRHGTLPARKEAVENLPTVKICELLQCSVCLDDFDKGSEAKEMPCKHKFHTQCILPWLELHSSCPVCRYELPPDDETKVDLVRPRTRTLEINISNENVEDNARNGNGSESRFSFPWPFSGLFSSSSSSSASASGSSQPNDNSYSG